MGVPGFSAAHRIAFNSSGSARSTWEKSNFKEAWAPGPEAGLWAVRSTCAGNASIGSNTGYRTDTEQRERPNSF